MQNQYDADTYDARVETTGNETFNIYKGPLGDVFNTLWRAIEDAKNRFFSK